MLSIVTTAVLSLIVVASFLYVGYKNRVKSKSAEEYFLMSHSLRRQGFASSYAAASTSVGTVIFFFVVLGLTHGAYILFAPFTLIIGVILFNKILLPRIPNEFFHKNDRHFMGTLGEFVRAKYESRIISLSVMAISLLGLMAILLIELYVGVSIFHVFGSENITSLSIVIICFVLFQYITWGGMNAVVKTDSVQIWVLIMPVIVILLFLASDSSGYSALLSMENIFPNPVISEGGFLLPWSMLLNVLVVNVFLTPSLLRTWQMTASANSRTDVGRGMLLGAIITVFLTMLYVALGIVFYKGIFTSDNPGLINMFEILRDSDENFLSNVLFPAFFVSCLAAMFSTLDSALLPIIHAIWVELKFKENERDGNARELSLSIVPTITFSILVFAIILYVGVFKFMGFDIISWMFTIFSFSIIVAPTIVFAMLLEEGVLRSKIGNIAALVSLAVSFVVAVTLTLFGNRIGNISLIQMNSPLAILAGTVPFAALWLVTKRKRLRV
ncbi:sodium:solute symporter family transporter [Microbaculum marinum]|uniref:Uncharacterized protein n=1 Tax=Microbaculum marinum TaxID=1764581 RepID=A0AAW9RP75_9HYPH